MVNDAVTRGATVLAGGRALPDLGEAFYAPTVLTNVAKRSKLYREEVFGPVVYVETVDSISEAIQRANDSEYGLNASVFADPRYCMGDCFAVGGGHRQHQRRLRGDLGQYRRPDGWLEGIGRGASPRRRGLIEVHNNTHCLLAARHASVRPWRGCAGNLYLCVEDGTEAGQTCAALTK